VQVAETLLPLYDTGRGDHLRDDSRFTAPEKQSDYPAQNP